MKIAVWTIRHVVVDDNVDSLNIDTAAKDIRRDADTFIEVFETLVAGDSTRMSWNARGKAIVGTYRSS